MTNRQTPCGFTSISWIVVVNPFGPHHCTMCLGSVHSFHTSSRGASYMRVAEISRSPTNRALLPSAILAAMFLLLGFQIEGLRILRVEVLCVAARQFADIVVQPVQALLPEAAIVLHPPGDILQGTGPQPARPPLRLAAASDETRTLQHLQMLGHCRHAHLKRSRQFGDGRLTQSQRRQNGTGGGSGQGRKRLAQMIRYFVLNHMIK